MASIQASSTATTGMTVDSSKNGAYVEEATMSGVSLSTMLTNVFPSAPAHTDSVPAGSPAFKNTSNALRALSTPGASRLITTYFITTHLPRVAGGPPDRRGRHTQVAPSQFRCHAPDWEGFDRAQGAQVSYRPEAFGDTSSTWETLKSGATRRDPMCRDTHFRPSRTRHVGMKAYTRNQRCRTGRRFREETGEVVVAGSGSCWWYLHRRS